MSRSTVSVSLPVNSASPADWNHSWDSGIQTHGYAPAPLPSWKSHPAWSSYPATSPEPWDIRLFDGFLKICFQFHIVECEFHWNANVSDTFRDHLCGKARGHERGNKKGRQRAGSYPQPVPEPYEVREYSHDLWGSKHFERYWMPRHGWAVSSSNRLIRFKWRSGAFMLPTAVRAPRHLL